MSAAKSHPPTEIPHAKNSASVALDLTSQLSLPGRTLVFCDDTEIAGQPIASLEPDLRILAAVQVPSEGYATIDTAITAALESHGLPEFHATDIATGNGLWKDRPEDERVAALRFVAGQLATHATRIGAVWLPKGQYAGLKKDAEKIGKVGVGFKHGLKRALVRSVVSRLATGSRPAMLWLDQDTPIAVPKVEHWPEAKFLIGGGPVASPSHLVRGLQLADLAAWSMQRFLLKRAGFDDETATAIDDVACEVVASFPTGIDDLRGDKHGDWAP